MLLGSLLISPIATIEEFTQLLFTSRSFSFVDLSFSYLGIWSCGLLASRFFDKYGTIRRVNALTTRELNLTPGLVFFPRGVNRE